MKNDLVLVAKLGRTIGIKGFVRLHNLSDFPEQFKRGASFFDENGRVYTIKTRSNESVLFEGFESIESAKNLVNLSLFQSIEQSRKSCKLGKDEFFYFDIIGLKVLDNGVLLGVVKDIIEAGANYLLLIATDEKLVVAEKKLAETDNKVTKAGKNIVAIDKKPTTSNKNSQDKANDKLSKSDKKLSAAYTKPATQSKPKEFYLPYVDFYVEKVDLANGQIHAQNALTLLESL